MEPLARRIAPRLVQHLARLQTPATLLIVAALVATSAYGHELPVWALEALVFALGVLGVPRPSDVAAAAHDGHVAASGTRLVLIRGDGTQLPVIGGLDEVEPTTVDDGPEDFDDDLPGIPAAG